MEREEANESPADGWTRSDLRRVALPPSALFRFSLAFKSTCLQLFCEETTATSHSLSRELGLLCCSNDGEGGGRARADPLLVSRSYSHFTDADKMGMLDDILGAFVSRVQFGALQRYS